MSKKKKEIKRLVKEYVAKECDHYSFEGHPTEIIRQLQKYYDRVPEEYRDSAYISWEEKYGYYDERRWEFSVSYERPETEEEQKSREEQENNSREMLKNRELELLKSLQKKYGAI